MMEDCTGLEENNGECWIMNLELEGKNVKSYKMAFQAGSKSKGWVNPVVGADWLKKQN